MTPNSTWHRLNQRIIACTKCPRLHAHCQQIAREKRAAFRNDQYHGKPVANFGDSQARLLIVGLAPAAHGANRTGRMFTGDRSGNFLYQAMYQAGFCNQPTATNARDGLKLIDTLITAALHCAPPANKPTVEEMNNCAPYLDETFGLLKNLRSVICLGQIGMNAVLKLYQRRGWIEKLAPYKFAHAAEHDVAGAPTILCSYHPSQQNTFTGRLTFEMLLDVFKCAQRIIESSE